MQVLIIGAGKVGFQLAATLSSENYNVTVIDKKQEVVDRVSEQLDVLALHGTGVSAGLLKKARVSAQDLLIAVTNSDEVNMIACMTGKRLGVGRTVARIRDPEYAEELAFDKEDVGIDFIINPERAAADEVTRLLTVSVAGHVEDLASGRVRMVEMCLDEGVDIAGKQIGDLALPDSFLIGAIARDGQVIIPRGDTKLCVGDIIYVIGKSQSVNEFFSAIGKYKPGIRKVMILGGGRIGYYLARNLVSRGIRVKIIEKDPLRCEELAEALPDVLVLNGDGTEIELLKSENVTTTDAFVAVTGYDEENLLTALLAKRLGAKKVIAKVSRPSYAPMAETIGVDAAISPRLIITGDILRFIRGGKLLSLFIFLGGRAEMLECIAQPSSPGVGRPLAQVDLPPNTLVATVIRGSEVIIPRGNTVIHPYDRVVVFAPVAESPRIAKVFGI